MQRTGTALIAGGSIGGLLAAAALQKAGWSVRVFERAGVELAGRGAGIVTHDRLIDAFRTLGANTGNLGVPVADRVAFDRAGDIVRRMSFPQIVTSWDRIYQILRCLMPAGSYRLGRTLVGYEEQDTGVTALFDDGSQESADLLVGADGFRSAIRGQMLPEVQPIYAGYVVWRAVTGEAALPPDVHTRLFADFGFYAPDGTQVLGYPIAGVGNDLRPGHRRYNFVWYSAVSDAALRDMLTDDEGTVYPISIPPPRVRAEVLERMRQEATRHLPAAFVEIIRQSERPFFTPIYDHCSPVFSKGRVALLGDAACVARPHAGMGVTKAAEDALALAHYVSEKPVRPALEAYSQDRLPKSRRAFEQGRRLGDYIFEDDSAGNGDGRNHPNIAAILADTAAPVN